MGLLTDVHGRGVFSSRPAAGHAGREYFATDTSVVYRDNGSSWDAQNSAGYAPGGTDVAVADGGTGASSASAARTNLGLVLGTDVASLTGGRVPIAQLASGTPDGTKFIRDDGVLATPAGGAGTAGGLLVAKKYSTGSDAAWATVTNATADIDATNAAITATIGSSGKAFVTVDLDVGFNYSSFPWGPAFLILRIGSTEIAAEPINFYTNAATDAVYAAVGGRYHAGFYVSGLTPGATTIKVGLRCVTYTTYAFANDASGAAGHYAGPFQMVVWDVP